MPADAAISALPAASLPLAGTDEFAIRQAGTTGRVARADVYRSLNAAYLKDDFITGTTGNNGPGEQRWKIVGTSVAISNRVAVANHPGVCRVGGPSSASGTVAMVLHSGNSSCLEADFFDTLWIVDPVQLGSTKHRVGIFRITASGADDPPTDGMYFEYLSATDTNWFFVTRAGSVQTRTDTGVAAAVGYIKFRIRRIDASTVAFTVNAGTETNVATNVPTGNGIQFVLQITVTTAGPQKSFDIDFWDLLITGLTR